MKMRFCLLTLFLLVSVRQSQAQSFYNGSIEPVSGSSVVSCQDNSYWNVNTIGNVFMTTTGPQKMYMVDNTCGMGYAKDGTHYIGLHFSPVLSKGNQLLLELNANMNAGQTYVFSFYYKGPSLLVGTGANLSYGYAVNDTTLDTSAVVYVTAPVDTVWRRVTGTVTPTVACRFIWVAARPRDSAPADSATTYVDDFVFNPVSVPDVNQNSSLHFYPVPVQTTANLELDDNVALPCDIKIYDIAGHIVFHENDIKSRKITLNKASAALKSGAYFLQLTDHNATRYTIKFTAN